MGNYSPVQIKLAGLSPEKLDVKFISMNDIKKIIYNCHQATLLIEKKQLERLTIREKMELRLHLAGCSVCKIFQRQSILISQRVKNLVRSSQKHSLDELYKKDLQDQINKKLK